jgi:RNA polymerase-binding transcription factor DksA
MCQKERVKFFNGWNCLNQLLKIKEMNKKNRFSDDELDEFKNIIELKLNRAKSELNYYMEQIQDLGEHINEDNHDWSEGAMIIGDLEMLNDLADRQKKFIRQLEAALMRVRQKTYGICTLTGELIDKRRLIVAPITTLSHDAKSILEQKNKVSVKETSKESDIPEITPAVPVPLSPKKTIKLLGYDDEADDLTPTEEDDEPSNYTSLDDIADDLGFEEEYNF